MANNYTNLGHPTKLSIAGDDAAGTVLKVNPDGSINTVPAPTPPASPANTVSVYNEITDVAMGSSQSVLSYIVPVGNTLQLVRIDISSDSRSIFIIEIDSVINSKRRIYFTDYNTVFNFGNAEVGLTVNAGSIINIIGSNESLNGVAMFNANLQGVLS